MGRWKNGGYNKEKKSHLPSVIDPIVDACLVELRTKYSCKVSIRLPSEMRTTTSDMWAQKIGAVGYCFGGKYVVRHLLPDKGKIDAGYTAHPSFVEVDELKAIKGPLAISAAEVDAIFPAEKRHETEAILKDLGVPYQVNLYGGVQHGFAVRGDLNKRNVQYAKESAFLQAVQWFKEHLEGGE